MRYFSTTQLLKINLVALSFYWLNIHEKIFIYENTFESYFQLNFNFILFASKKLKVPITIIILVATPTHQHQNQLQPNIILIPTLIKPISSNIFIKQVANTVFTNKISRLRQRTHKNISHNEEIKSIYLSYNSCQ